MKKVFYVDILHMKWQQCFHILHLHQVNALFCTCYYVSALQVIVPATLIFLSLLGSRCSKRPGYSVMFKMMARKMLDGGCRFVNLEQFFKLQNKVSTRNLCLVIISGRGKVFSVQVAQALCTEVKLLVHVRVIKCTKWDLSLCFILMFVWSWSKFKASYAGYVNVFLGFSPTENKLTL